MPNFPRGESDIVALAKSVTEGFAKVPEIFPAPPISFDEMQARRARHDAAIAATILAENAFRAQHATKDQAQADVVDGLKINLKYAEAVARNNPEHLTILGWGPRRDGSGLKAPGEVRDIAVVSQSESSIHLRWNPPADGGIPAFYQIQRMREGGPWEDAGTATATEQLLLNQPKGVPLTYWVIAVNKAGAGQPSGIVKVVL